MSVIETVKLPTLRTPVEVLSHHWGEWLPSRVEDGDKLRLTVAAPSTPTIPVLLPDPGDSVKVQWVCSRGLCELEARVDHCIRSPLPVWVMTPLGAPVLYQRRRYARIEVALRVAYSLHRSNKPNEIGTTVNIGEGGMTCILSPAQLIEAGDTAQVIVSIEGEPFYAQAHCLRTATTETGRKTASFRFEQLELHDADRIRRFIFHEEMRRRAQGRS